MNNTPIYAHCPEKELSVAKKLKISFFAALIFFFVSSPIMYQLMNKYDENYYDIPWTEDINGGKDSIYKRLLEISNTVLSLDNINSGRLLPTRGKK